MGYRGYSTANGHIVAKDGTGDFSTIQSAINAASSGQTIFIRPGTYTENPTLKPGVDLASYDADSLTPNVIINGNCSLNSAGTVSISGIRLQTNSSNLLTVSGSAASIVNLKNCYLNCSNNTGISYSSSSASSRIFVANCQGDLGTTGIAIFSASGAGEVHFDYCTFTNTGGSSTASSTSASVIRYNYCFLASPFSTSSTGIVFFTYSNVNTSTQNTTCFTTAGTGNSVLEYSDFISGTASAISVGTGTAVLGLGPIRVDSSNTSAITGSGVMNYSQIIYTSSSSNNQTTTQSAYPGSGWQLLQTATASNSASLAFTNIGIYKIYVVVIDSILPATNTANLQVLASSNNGSTYANSGYTAGVNYNAYNSATVNNTNATTFGPITGPSSNGAQIQGTIYFTAGTGRYIGSITYLDTTLAVQANGTCGGSTGVSINALKFQMSTGNITSGRISIYGIPS